MDNRRSYTPTMYEGAPRRRQASRKRMDELAKPRASTYSDVRISTIGRHLEWGGQEPINPIRTETLFAVPSERLERLSAPKRVFKGKLLQDPEYLYSAFSAGKTRKQSFQDDDPSDRILELSDSKRYTPKYKKESRIDGEPIPMGTGNQESLWPIEKPVLLAKATSRLESLAEQKRVFQIENINPEFMYSSSDISTMKYGVSDAAKKASASDRVAQLAEPKKDFSKT